MATDHGTILTSPILSSEDVDARTAQFRPADKGSEGVTDMTLDRQAIFRPSEHIAARRDLVERYIDACRTDANFVAEDSKTYFETLFGSALGDETLSRFDRAWRTLGQLPEAFQISPELLAMRRRLARAMEEGGLVCDNLEKSYIFERGSFKALTGLELAQTLWQSNAPIEEVSKWIDRVMREFDLKTENALDKMSNFIATWTTLISVDVALVEGDVVRAAELLEVLSEHVELAGAVKRNLRSMAASWFAAVGELTKAKNCLEVLDDVSGLNEDVEESYLRIMFDLGDRKSAAKFIRRRPFIYEDPRRRIVDAMCVDGKDAIASLLETPDSSSLHFQAALDFIRTTPQAGSAQLIDVLNANLETPELSAGLRVAYLCELAAEYEKKGGEADAADALREALGLIPDHAPAIRALGRLYHRTNEVNQLTDLYEQEISVRLEEEGTWRRRFQVAQLYENEVNGLDNALSHYVAVLKQKPGYLPALKGAARLCETTGQWARIAGLFLEAVPHTNSSRQKIYLLEKVASLAEHHLNNDSAAIDAWEEILSFMPGHPNAYAILGRLYAKNKRWHDLVHLNATESDLVDDGEEIATLFTRNAEIAENEICDSKLAEEYFTKALYYIPDFLPALEGLGRILTRAHRWDDLVEMNRSQLDVIQDLRERYRQSIILAEIYETRLGDLEKAESLYRYASGLDVDNAFAKINLNRLKKAQHKWDDVYTIQTRAEVRDERYLGYLCEWKRESFEEAYSHYRSALHLEPTDLLSLDGLTRTWASAGVEAGELADELENLLLSPMDGPSRDSYFLALARLREIDEKTPEASRAYRAHGDRTHFENKSVLRLSMGLSDERSALVDLRRHEPLLENESRIVLPRHGLSVQDREFFDAGFEILEESEQRWLLRETDARVLAQTKLNVEDTWLELVQQYGRVLYSEDEEVSRDKKFRGAIQRFLAIEARENGDMEMFRQRTENEIEDLLSEDIRVRRQLEIARYIGFKEDRLEIFSKLVDDFERIKENILPETGDAILAGLETFEMWSHFVKIAKDILKGFDKEDGSYVSLLSRVAEIEALHLEEKENAAEHFFECWELAKDPKYLMALVRIAEEKNDLELACEYQQLHFGAIRNSEFESSARTISERLESGLKLSELLVKTDRASDSIHLMEELLHPHSDDTNYRKLVSLLGALHAKSGDARRAVSLFEEHLPMTPGPTDVEDWNVLVSTYLNVLEDLSAAYRLQWNLVRSIPSDRKHLETLVEIAVDIDEVEDCCEQLEAFSEICEPEVCVSLLVFVAEVYEEELFSADDSVRIYSRLLEDEELVLNDATRILAQRRQAFELSKVAGKEKDALAAFTALVEDALFEPTIYRGMVGLFTKLQAFDRARTSGQILKVLGCDVEMDSFRAKQNPSREVETDVFSTHVFSEDFKNIFPALRTIMPLVEKVWGDELPQRKAMSGERLRGGAVLESLEDAFSGFGIKKFRAIVGDSGPLMPQVIPDGTVWMNEDILEKLTPSETRFYTAYAAAIAWSDLTSVLSLDGRELWHLLEGIHLKQTGEGFSGRVDIKSQDLAETFGGAFYSVARRRVIQAIGENIDCFATAYCEAWPKEVEQIGFRYATAVCGDVYSAVSALLKMKGWDGKIEESATQSYIRKDAKIRDLLAFSNSQEYLELRFALGLSGKPSTLF